MSQVLEERIEKQVYCTGIYVSEKNLSGLIFLHHCLLGNQEISAFGKNGEGDSGDHWKVICSNTFWERDQAVRLKHVDTET